MRLLSSIKHEHLTEDVIKDLKNNNVDSVIDFLQEDVERLVTVTKLSYINVVNLRKYIIEEYKACILTGKECIDRCNTYLQFIGTGVPKLDSIIDGGLPAGEIVEICGFPGSGKTQLAFTISCHIANSYKNKVYYVNTKGDFSAIRIHEILSENGLNNDEVETVMDRISVVTVFNMLELVNFLQKISDNVNMCELVMAIIIDSLPVLMLQFIGDAYFEGLGLLNRFVNISRCIKDRFHVSFIIINSFSCSSESFNEVEGDEKYVPALGKYWQHIPRLFLYLEKKPEGVLVTVKKDYCENIKNIIVRLTSKGIS